MVTASEDCSHPGNVNGPFCETETGILMRVVYAAYKAGCACEMAEVPVRGNTVDGWSWRV